MLEIGFNNVKKNFGYKDILNGLSFEVISGDRLAIIGKNGSGKTTILNILANIETADSGLVTIRNNATVGYLKQTEEIIEDEVNVNDVIKTGQKELMNLEKKMLDIAKEMENSNCEISKLLKQYERIQNEYIAGGGYELEESFNKICTGCKISKEMLEKSYNMLSGGEKTIVNIARVLYSKPDILLLDEPTNHLDVQATEWLEGFIKKYNGTVIIISHDRYFIDKVATKTLLIENGVGELYYGNYSYFLKEDEKRVMSQFENYKNQQKQIKAMEESIKKLREFGTRAGNEMFFKRAFSIQKRLEKLDVTQRPITEKAIPLNFEIKNRSGKNVIGIKDLEIVLGNRVLLNNANMNIYYGDKVCLLGKNGSGKSTLIKTILGEIKPNIGEIIIGSNVNIGYIPQKISFENEQNTILSIFGEYCKGTETQKRSKLARFMFNGENVFKKVGNLSGGERVKLKLACLMEQDVNCIVLDEPTNHIDINTRETLEDTLKEYKGTIIFVTHDRYFANKLAGKIIEINNKKIYEFMGNYDDYKNKIIYEVT